MIFEVFEQALDLAPRERAAFVEEACGDDPALRSEVEALLAAHERADSLPPGPGAVATEIFSAGGAGAPRAAASPFHPGRVVDGKYRIDALLGTGGMGAVYRATHLQLERVVALKTIRAELLANPTTAERFRREAVAVARLRHPHIVTVHDYGVTSESGAYLVMELLEGHSLRDELTGDKPIDVATALAIVAQVCAAVGAAHRAGVIHRDIKPENIFVERRDGAIAVKVVDFGLAKLEAPVQGIGGDLTNKGAVLGTPLYMSPEQCRGEEADMRSDVYAIGCVLYEMLTGERPFTGKTVWALVYKHVNETPRRPRELVGGLPPHIDEALMRALAKDPADRYQSAEAFAEALGALAAHTATPSSTPVTPIAGATSARRTPNNLPHALTTFVGRERQIGEVREWLSRARLVTLTGPGGIGKTRLALETASHVLGEYEDGVWLVELAPLTDPALVVRAIASALVVREQGGRTEIESIEAWLRDKKLLLVLDNCEHLVEACAEIAARLLTASAGLRLLATSRESLAIAGEAAWPVPALTVPSRSAGQELAGEAARLFVDRASLAKPGFVLTDATAPVVAELVRRLEGIPLAIELAAARVKALTVEQILERLADRFRLLASGSQRAPTRQQTLRATLDWSYDLLTDDERTLLARLGVFAGGWTLQSAEDVASGQWPVVGVGEDAPTPTTDHRPLTTSSVLDLLSRLVDKSLVVAQGQTLQRRFYMLEVVREYARERLAESGEADEAARRHADVFRALAVTASTKFVGAKEAEWLALFEAEHDNMRAALGWLLEHDPDGCLALAVEITGFWSLHGHFVEGLQWLTGALERSDAAASFLRVKALRSAGELAWRTGDLTAARAHLEESMRMARELGDARQISWSAFHLALVIQQQGDAAASCPYLEESLSLARALGDDRLVGNALNSLGEAARIEGDWQRALPFFLQSLETHREMGHPVGLSVTLCNLGAALCDAGDVEGACARYLEALPSLAELGNAMGMSLALDGLAAVAAKRREWERAARLAGAAAALRDEIGGELEPADRQLRERCLREVGEHMEKAAIEAAMAEGRATARGEAIEDALSM